MRDDAQSARGSSPVKSGVPALRAEGSNPSRSAITTPALNEGWGSDVLGGVRASHYDKSD